VSWQLDKSEKAIQEGSCEERLEKLQMKSIALTLEQSKARSKEQGAYKECFSIDIVNNNMTITSDVSLLLCIS
jgi:hypothetical protein